MSRGRGRGRGRVKGVLPVQGGMAPQVIFLVPVSTTYVCGQDRLWGHHQVSGLNTRTRIVRFLSADDKGFGQGSVLDAGIYFATSSYDEGIDTILGLLCRCAVKKTGRAKVRRSETYHNKEASEIKTLMILWDSCIEKAGGWGTCYLYWLRFAVAALDIMWQASGCWQYLHAQSIGHVSINHGNIHDMGANDPTMS